MNESTGRRVLLAGATGLVGGFCLSLLVADSRVSKIHVLVRRPLPAGTKNPKVVEEIVDFEKLDSIDPFPAVDDVFCALGTTIRQAGSQGAFRRVDLEYPLTIARLAIGNGARHLLLVSALGADAGSRIFYNRVKGELENAVTKIGFRSVTIARPSFLLGHREEFRFGEQIGKRIGWLFPARYRPIEARKVAEALIRAAGIDAAGVHILENAELRSSQTTLPA